MRLTLSFLLWLWLPTSAWGHAFDLGFIQLEGSGGRYSAVFTLNRELVETLLEKKNVSEVTLQSESEGLMKRTLFQGSLTSQDQPCEWGAVVGSWDGASGKFQFPILCPSEGQTLRWTFPWLGMEAIPSSFQILLRMKQMDAEQVHLVTRENPLAELSPTGGVGLWHFIWMGVEHIGMAPSEWLSDEGKLQLPDGIDHILFLLALVLGGGTLWQLVMMATGFTIGHSITLILASLEWVSLPSRFVESVIALSIAYVAAETFFRKEPRHRWRVAVLFGLVHGLGFATAITDLQLSGWLLVKALFGYNLGVELGQLVLILIVVPLLLMLYRKPKLKAYILPAGSIVIFVAGFVWFVERALGL